MSLSKLFNSASGDERHSPKTLMIRRPDDWHVHLRDGAMLKAVLPFTAAQFARGMIMPNLTPPVTNCGEALAYKRRICDALPEGASFEPLMTCYLTATTSPDEIELGYREGAWLAAKLYPAGATTNADHGVTDIPALAPVFERMEKIGMAVLIHGEATDPEIDIFDRENVFMEQSLLPLLKAHPALKVVVEHATTEETLEIVREHSSRVACTITAHHLIINRTSIFQGGLQPHLYCLPIAKRERHRKALRKAATSGDACFMLGTDTAPHSRASKEAECCSAGVFSGATALQTYAQVFDEENALDKLEAFASLNGAHFHGLPLNEGSITLVRKPSMTLSALPAGIDEVVVFQGGQVLPWSISSASIVGG